MAKAKEILIKNNYLYLGLIILLAFALYSPSLFNYYSHDDFFHLNISQASSLSDFLNFFNLFTAPQDYGFFRPLTTQVYYFLAWKLFSLNPLPLHVLSFLVFFTLILLVYQLTWQLTSNKTTSLIASFFYAVSSTHFGHLYYLGAFQELGLAFFAFSSSLLFIHFLKTGKKKNYLLAIVLFVGGLLSKEFAVMTPFTFLLLYSYFCLKKEKTIPLKTFLISLIPFLSILSTYLYLHIFYYGLAKGDSYVWDFSPRVANTIIWYLLWSFNLPEMLVDFIGPGFKPIPNLFLYYGREVGPMLFVFGIMILTLIMTVMLQIRRNQIKFLIHLFSLAWFLVTLLPVLFLPLHKFTYELTVPLFGVVLSFSSFFDKTKKIYLGIFLINFLSLSLMTNLLTYRTHWIVQGGSIAKRVVQYLNLYQQKFLGKTLIFYDSQEDAKLPWRPNEMLKNTLSDNNFFQVIYHDKIKAIYTSSNIDKNKPEAIRARQFLNY